MTNLIIAILTDSYELVTSEKKYYDSKVKIHRSLMYERLQTIIFSSFKKQTDQTYSYLFISKPLKFKDEADHE